MARNMVRGSRSRCMGGITLDANERGQTELNISDQGLSKLPTDYYKFSRTEAIIASNNNLEELPAALGSLKQLQTLEAQKNKIRSIPREIYKCHRLKYLDISDNRVSTLPSDGENSLHLKYLLLAGNRFASLINGITSVTSLICLNASRNQIQDVAKLSCLRQLVMLDLSENAIKEMPDDISSLTHLRSINLSHNQLSDLPAISSWAKLEDLDLSHNNFSHIPKGTFQLRCLRVLNMGCNSMTRIAGQIDELISLEELHLENNEISKSVLLRSSSLTYINLAHNKLTDFSFKGMKKMQYINCSSNRLEYFPSGIADCGALNVIVLRDNLIKEIPACITQLEQLQVLDLENSHILEMPAAVTQMRHLLKFSIWQNKKFEAFRDQSSKAGKLPSTDKLCKTDKPEQASTNYSQQTKLTKSSDSKAKMEAVRPRDPRPGHTSPIVESRIMPCLKKRTMELSQFHQKAEMFVAHETQPHSSQATRGHSSVGEPVVRSHSRVREPVVRSHSSVGEPVVRSHSRVREPVVRSHSSDREPVMREHSVYPDQLHPQVHSLQRDTKQISQQMEKKRSRRRRAKSAPSTDFSLTRAAWPVSPPPHPLWPDDLQPCETDSGLIVERINSNLVNLQSKRRSEDVQKRKLSRSLSHHILRLSRRPSQSSMESDCTLPTTSIDDMLSTSSECSHSCDLSLNQGPPHTITMIGGQLSVPEVPGIKIKFPPGSVEGQYSFLIKMESHPMSILSQLKQCTEGKLLDSIYYLGPVVYIEGPENYSVTFRKPVTLQFSVEKALRSGYLYVLNYTRDNLSTRLAGTFSQEDGRVHVSITQFTRGTGIGVVISTETSTWKTVNLVNTLLDLIYL